MRSSLRVVRRGSCGAFAALLAAVIAFWLSAPRVVAMEGEAGAANPTVVFVSRALSDVSDPLHRESVIHRGTRGRLLVAEPGAQPRVLVDAAAPGAPGGLPVDVMDPDVSFDGLRIVFSGFNAAERSWRIYEIDANAATNGAALRQVTRSDRQIDLNRYGEAAAGFQSYDDVDPCYLPDGRICFVSTRYPGVAPDGRMRATNLYVVEATGSDLHRITTERFGADTPAVDPLTGQIVYSRWWRTPRFQVGAAGDETESIPPGSPGYGDAGGGGADPTTGQPRTDAVLRGVSDDEFPGVNNWFLSSIHPDGTGLAMLSGFRLDRELTQAYRPSFRADGEILALFIPQTPFIGLPRGNGLRLFSRGASMPEFWGGPQTFSQFAGQVGGGLPFPVPPEPGRETPLVYASAAALADGRILVSALLDRAGLDYDLYIQSAPNEIPVRLLGIPGMAELDAVPLQPRALPPALPDQTRTRLLEEAPRTVAEAIAQAGTFTFLCENIHFNAPVDIGIATAPPVGKRLAIEFFMAPQRTSATEPDAPILIRREEIGADGRIEVDLPAGVPLFEVLRRPDGAIPIGRDGQIFHVGGMNFNRADQGGACVGCHAGHSMVAAPEDATWTNLAPSARVSASSSLQAAIDAVNVLQPTALVDRRTDPLVSEWAAADGVRPQETVTLRWNVPIQAREVVIYGPSHGHGRIGTRNQTIHRLEVNTYLLGGLIQPLQVPRDIVPEGTHVDLDPESVFDRLEITIRRENVSGPFEGRSNVALAEIEVIARATADVEPSVFFTRGDIDCDSRVNITDAVSLLNTLFLNGPALCCGSAADTNVDSRIDLTDAVVLADHAFRGADPLAAPFPGCGRASEGRFVCEQETCP